jgi:hypothetical protein
MRILIAIAIGGVSLAIYNAGNDLWKEAAFVLICCGVYKYMRKR